MSPTELGLSNDAMTDSMSIFSTALIILNPNVQTQWLRLTWVIFWIRWEWNSFNWITVSQRMEQTRKSRNLYSIWSSMQRYLKWMNDHGPESLHSYFISAAIICIATIFLFCGYFNTIPWYLLFGFESKRLIDWHANLR